MPLFVVLRQPAKRGGLDQLKLCCWQAQLSTGLLAGPLTLRAGAQLLRGFRVINDRPSLMLADLLLTQRHKGSSALP